MALKWHGRAAPRKRIIRQFLQFNHLVGECFVGKLPILENCALKAALLLLYSNCWFASYGDKRAVE